jgi:acyl-homoserine-lactone acylase
MRIGIWAAGCAPLLAAPAVHAKYRHDATTTRITYGIPHIKASTWQGVGYGVAYAYAEDNLCLLAEEFATVAGERSRHWGPEGKAVLGFQEIDNLASDLFFRAAIELPALRTGFARQSRASRALAEGYIAATTASSRMPEPRVSRRNAAARPGCGRSHSTMCCA